MDNVWDCMNIASRITKQIESTDNLVPKQQLGNVTPVADLQELTTSVNSVRTTLVPFVTSSKKKVELLQRLLSKFVSKESRILSTNYTTSSKIWKKNFRFTRGRHKKLKSINKTFF